MRADFLELFDLFVAELHVLVFGEFVAFDHCIAIDDDAFLLTDVLLSQARAAILVQQIERDAVAGLSRRVQLHGNGNESEGDGQGSD